MSESKPATSTTPYLYMPVSGKAGASKVYLREGAEGNPERVLLGVVVRTSATSYTAYEPAVEGAEPVPHPVEGNREGAAQVLHYEWSTAQAKPEAAPKPKGAKAAPAAKPAGAKAGNAEPKAEAEAPVLGARAASRVEPGVAWLMEHEGQGYAVREVEEALGLAGKTLGSALLRLSLRSATTGFYLVECNYPRNAGNALKPGQRVYRGFMYLSPAKRAKSAPKPAPAFVRGVAPAVVVEPKPAPAVQAKAATPSRAPKPATTGAKPGAGKAPAKRATAKAGAGK